MMKTFAIALLCVLLVGCAAPVTKSPVGSPTLETFALPTVNGASDACAGIGLVGATLTGDPHDPRVAWLKSPANGGRIDIVFPPGFSARFTPRLEILDAAGQVVARDGDPVEGGCDTGGGVGAPLLVFWP